MPLGNANTFLLTELVMSCYIRFLVTELAGSMLAFNLFLFFLY